MTTAHGSSPLRTIQCDGTRYISVADVVTICRDMAATLKDGHGRGTLHSLADTLAPLVGAGEILPPPDLPPVRHACGQLVRQVDQMADLPSVVLNARPTPYGHWLILQGADRVVALPYDGRRHPSTFARYREHVCPGAPR